MVPCNPKILENNFIMQPRLYEIPYTPLHAIVTGPPTQCRGSQTRKFLVCLARRVLPPGELHCAVECYRRRRRHTPWHLSSITLHGAM